MMKTRILPREDNVLRDNSPARKSEHTNNIFVTQRAFPGQVVKFKVADFRISLDRIT